MFNLELAVDDDNSFVNIVNNVKSFQDDNQNLSFYNTNHIDWVKVNEFLLGVDWNAMFSYNNCIDFCWESFYSAIVYSVSLFAPAKNKSTNHRRLPRHGAGKKHNSLPKHIRRLCSKKAKFWRRYKARPSLLREATYKKYSDLYVRELKKHITSIENELINSKHCRSFYNYANKKFKSKVSIPLLLDSYNNIVVDDLQKANIFCSHFSSVFVQDNGTIPHEDNEQLNCKTSVNIESIYFSSINVFDKIKKMKSSSAPGFDGISANLLKKLSNILSIPLSILFNLSISSGKVPKAWKRAIVVPVYKKGESKIPTNYRPISLTSIVSKLMEGIIKDSIIRHCNVNNLLSDDQFAFLPRRSANLQLMQYHDLIATNCSKGFQTDSVYLDFKAAFDSVVHSKLLYKLKLFGVHGSMLNWIRYFSD